MKIDVDTVITKANGQKYALLSKTEQDGKTYFYGLLLNEKEEPGTESKIFILTNYEGNDYLEEVTDPKVIPVLASIFINDLYKKGMNNSNEESED